MNIGCHTQSTRIKQMKDNKKIYCCGCCHDVQARLTDGAEIYPHRQDLKDLPFWKCDKCKNYVGCHHKTRQRTKPLGNIPTPDLRDARQKIHKILDPLWKDGKIERGRLYHEIAGELGIQVFHTSEIKTLEEGRKAYRAIQKIKKDLEPCQRQML